MWEKIKKKAKDFFETKYIIIRNGLIPWQMIYADRVETRVVLAKSELLSIASWMDGFHFTQRIKHAYLSNGIWSWMLMKVLINRNGNDYKYKRIRAVDVVFITDLTALTEN